MKLSNMLIISTYDNGWNWSIVDWVNNNIKAKAYGTNNFINISIVDGTGAVIHSDSLRKTYTEIAMKVSEDYCTTAEEIRKLFPALQSYQLIVVAQDGGVSISTKNMNSSITPSDDDRGIPESTNDIDISDDKLPF